MLDFPSSPPVDTLYPDPAIDGVPQWRFDGDRWIDVVTEDGGARVTVDVDPPDEPRPGDLWFDSISLTLFLWYEDDAGAAWIPASPTGGGAKGGASIAVSPTAPTDHEDGDLWWNSTNGLLFVSFSGAWIAVSGPAGPGGAKIITSATAPTDVEDGDLWWDTTNGLMFINFASAWIAVGGPAGPPGADGGVTVAAVAPTAPTEGALWWDSNSGVLYIRFGAAWVAASAAGPQGPEGPPGPSTIATMGVTDGSDAQPGEVGENLIFSNMTVATSNTQGTQRLQGYIPAGDWDVTALLQFYTTSAGGTFAGQGYLELAVSPLRDFDLMYPSSIASAMQVPPANVTLCQPSFGPARLNLNQGVTVTLQSTTNFSPFPGAPGISVRARLRARRMR